ncbi:MAG: hypothetical protein NTY83_00235 [Candidatus Micrarchaeota archaeon]|nr:hypothetical protein [Candidatus Micrarchaeota archaeon]
MAEAQSTSERVADSGRRPIRNSPPLENSKLARLLRDLCSSDSRLACAAAHEFRHIASKRADISEAFPAFRVALRSEDAYLVGNILWALKYAKQNGADISILLPCIQELRHSPEGTIRSLATVVLEGTASPG